MPFLRSLAVAAVAVAAPALGHAQVATVELVPQAGYAVFGDLWKGPLGTSVRSRNGAFYAVQLGVNPSPVLGLTASVGYARSDLEAGLPILGGAAFGTAETIYYDAGLQLRLPITGNGVTPFLQAGAGGVRNNLETGVVNIDATSPAFHVGGGLDIDLSRNLGLRLQLRDYISKFDAREAILLDVNGATGHTLAFTVGVRAGF